MIGRRVVSSSMRAVCARCARASASGPTPTTDDELTVDVALGVAKLGGKTVHSVAVDHTVGDQPHRAADQVGARVPLGRARAWHPVGSACRP